MTVIHVTLLLPIGSSFLLGHVGTSSSSFLNNRLWFLRVSKCTATHVMPAHLFLIQEAGHILWNFENEHIIIALMLGPSLCLYVYKILCARIIELIFYHTCNLCTSLRTYAIKAMSCGFSGGKQVINAASTKNTVEFVYSRQQKIYNFLP